MQIIALVIVCSLLCFADGYILKGDRNSYMAFNSWRICSKELRLTFRSYAPNGLLLYQDDEGGDNYMELKLVESTLRLTYKIRRGQLLNFTTGENLALGEWHNVTISKSGNRMKFELTHSFAQESLSRRDSASLCSQSRRSKLFVGGLPQLYALRSENLSLPSVFFEPNLIGEVHSLRMVNNAGQGVELTPTAFNGLANQSETVGCAAGRNPCMNGGRCLSPDVCDCQYTFYKGPTCAEEQQEMIATFSGTDYLYYNFTTRGGAIMSNKEEVYLSFKTLSGEGLLFYTGDDGRYLNVGLHEGVIYLVNNLGEKEEAKSIGKGRQFDDNHWHHIVITRNVTEMAARSLGVITVSVDGMYGIRWSSFGDFSRMASKVLFVGGTEHLDKLPGTKATDNFIGCLKEVKFNADSLQFKLLELAQSGSGFLSQEGNVKYGECNPILQDEAVSILHSEDTILLPKFSTSRPNFVSFTFKTSVGDGLLLYATGNGSTTFAIEIFRNYLYLILDHDGVLLREQISDNRVSTGAEKKLHITLNNWGATAELNNVPKTVSLGDQNMPNLELTSPISLAGIDDSRLSVDIHPGVYTAGLRRGFIGCIKDVKIDGVSQNVRQLARMQKIKVAFRCNQSDASCLGNKCQNGGLCEERWQSSACRCEMTPYMGPHCTLERPILRFNGDQHFIVKPRVKVSTVVDDISIQFKTRRSHGSLLNTRSLDRRSGIDVFFYLGKLYVQITLMGTEHILVAGEALHDNKWHTLSISRLKNEIRITLDRRAVSNERIRSSASNLRHHSISMYEIKLGQPIDRGSISYRSSVDDEPSSRTPFIGHVRQLFFNNKHYLQLALKDADPQITFNAEFNAEPVPPSLPYSFGSAGTYVTQPSTHISGLTTLYLQIKTPEPNGLVLFRAGRASDFFALELVEGWLRYVFRIKNKVGKVTDARRKLNDNKWHSIAIMRQHNGSHLLHIDDDIFISEVTVMKDFEFTSPLYIASVPKVKYGPLKRFVLSVKGYKGCMASLDINGHREDLSEGNGSHDKLVKGCVDAPTCTASSCKNSGKCVEKWPTISCLCHMTSYTGPTCAQDGTSYYFGSSGKGGMVVYEFQSPYNDTFEDTLAFGFTTSMSTRATLFKLTSSNSADFLDVTMMEGRLTVLYNVGSGDHVLSSTGSYNDDQYHVFKLIRDMSNATLQIDNGPVVYSNPTVDGRSMKKRRQSADGPSAQLRAFNSQSKALIGGKLSRSGAIVHPFKGHISGLSLNNVNILDLAKSNNPFITIQGDARMAPLDKRKKNVMVQDVHAASYGDVDGKDSDEIILPSGNVPCNAGLNPDFCNQDTGNGEIISRTITQSEVVPAIITRRPPEIPWPENGYEFTTKRRMPTKKMSPRRPPTTSSNNQETPRKVPSELELSTHGPFDLRKNLPLIIGICGAALITLILIGVIIYRLTKKQERNYATPKARPSCSVDEDLKNDINGHRTNSSTPNMALPVNSLNRRSGSKEWYV